MSITITGLGTTDVGSSDPSPGSNLPFANVVINGATSADTYVVTVSTGSIYFNGVNYGTTYNGTVGDGVLNKLNFIAGPTAARIFVGVDQTPNGDGTFSYAAQGTERVNCFVVGTRIACPEGDRAIESIKAGELVLTASGEAVPVMFVGRRHLSLANTPEHRPVRLPAGSLADGVPSRDLEISPDHAVMFGDVLVPARNLIGGPIRQVDVAEVTYLHIQLADHNVILAEGAPCETLLDTDDHSIFDNGHEGVVTDGFLSPYLPRVTQGPALEAILAQIEARLTVTA